MFPTPMFPLQLFPAGLFSRYTHTANPAMAATVLSRNTSFANARAGNSVSANGTVGSKRQPQSPSFLSENTSYGNGRSVNAISANGSTKYIPPTPFLPASHVDPFASVLIG